MTAKQEALLARYRDLWTDYNVTASLIEHLNDRLRDIKAEQRRLANQIAAEQQEAGNGTPETA